MFCWPRLITQCPGSPESGDAGRRRADLGTRAPEGEGSPVGTLSQAPASHNNFTKFNILQPNQISDELQNSIQDTTTKTPTRELKTRPKSKSNSDKFERNQSLAERNYRLLRRKYNKKARSTTAKTFESSTILTTTSSTTTLTTTTTITTTERT